MDEKAGDEESRHKSNSSAVLGQTQAMHFPELHQPAAKEDSPNNPDDYTNAGEQGGNGRGDTELSLEDLCQERDQTSDLRRKP